jgi:hypothetical protein
VSIQAFALFIDDGKKGPKFREYCTDIEIARKRAQELADQEGLPFLVFNLMGTRTVGVFRPRPERSPHPWTHGGSRGECG